MPRFYLPPGQCQGPVLRLTEREAPHALHVLRLARGEALSALDGAGHEFLCEVQNTGRDYLDLHVRETRSSPAPVCQVTLLQALPKGKLIEFIIQKATELGAARIVPLLSERVVSRLEGESAAQKALKWQWVAIDAIKQCGARWLPKVEPPLTPQEWLARGEKFELPLVAALQGEARHPSAYFQAFRQQHQRQPGSACVWVGPEGDFSPGELGTIIGAGALPITLGPLVLRADTAALYCLSILSYELSGGSEV